MDARDPPYHRAITLLKQLPLHQDPATKIRLLVMTAEAIVQCINQYYASLNTPAPSVYATPHLRAQARTLLPSFLTYAIH